MRFSHLFTVVKWDILKNIPAPNDLPTDTWRVGILNEMSRNKKHLAILGGACACAFDGPAFATLAETS